MMASTQDKVLNALTGLGIDYQLVQHPPVATMADLTAIGVKTGVPHVKNLFLSNRQKTRFYLLLLRGDQAFRTAVVSKQLQVARLSFADPDALMALLQTEPGAVSPLGLLFDQNRQVELVLEKSLEQDERFCFHPCVNTASLLMTREAFLQVFLQHTGHRPRWISLNDGS